MRIVSVYANSNGSYNEAGTIFFEIKNGDVFAWNNCIIQIDDEWGNMYAELQDQEMMSTYYSNKVTCSVMSVIRSSFPFFHTDSGLSVGRRLYFPLEFAAVSVNNRYIPPTPEPPPPPPPEPLTKFETLAGEQ